MITTRVLYHCVPTMPHLSHFLKEWLPELNNVRAVPNGLVPLPGMVEVAAFALVVVAEVGGVGAHQDDGMDFNEKNSFRM